MPAPGGGGVRVVAAALDERRQDRRLLALLAGRQILPEPHEVELEALGVVAVDKLLEDPELELLHRRL